MALVSFVRDMLDMKTRVEDHTIQVDDGSLVVKRVGYSDIEGPVGVSIYVEKRHDEDVTEVCVDITTQTPMSEECFEKNYEDVKSFLLSIVDDPTLDENENGMNDENNISVVVKGTNPNITLGKAVKTREFPYDLGIAILGPKHYGDLFCKVYVAVRDETKFSQEDVDKENAEEIDYLGVHE